MAQTASIDQQREIMRYLRALNDWLGRDVQDRQSEIRAVAARVDQLRDLLLQVLNSQGQGMSMLKIFLSASHLLQFKVLQHLAHLLHLVLQARHHSYSLRVCSTLQWSFSRQWCPCLNHNQ